MRVRVADEFVPLLVGIRGVADVCIYIYIYQRARNGRAMVAQISEGHENGAVGFGTIRRPSSEAQSQISHPSVSVFS